MSIEPAPSVDESSKPLSGLRIAACSTTIVIGIMLGLVSLALASNRFGNYDMIGVNLFGLSGGIVATGVARLFYGLRKSFAVGVLAAPLSIAALFTLFWVLVLSTAFANRAGSVPGNIVR